MPVLNSKDHQTLVGPRAYCTHHTRRTNRASHRVAAWSLNTFQIAHLLSWARRQRFQVLVGVLTLTALLGVTFPTFSFAVTGRPLAIMVYGDSLSAGYGLKPDESWVALMDKQLANRRVNVINASISGETTSGAQARIKTDLARHKPDIVIVALGGNDGLRGLPVADMRRNLSSMLDDIRRTGARAILAGIQIPPNYGIEYTKNFRNVFSSLAAERKLLLVPFLLEGIAESLDNFQADRIHPTAAVQPRILQNVMPAVEAALAQSAKPSVAKPVP
jgi:acyl-CoA thioesterase I